MLAKAYNRMGVTSGVMGQMALSRQYHEKSNEVARMINDTALQVSNMIGQALADKLEGKYASALQKYFQTDSLVRLTRESDQYRIGLINHNIGLIYLEFMDDPGKAIEYLQLAKIAYGKMTRTTGEISSIDAALARVYVKMNKANVADSLFSSALITFRSIGHTKKIAETALAYSALKQSTGEMKEAKALLDETKDIYESLSLPGPLANVHHQLGLFYRATNNLPASIDHFAEAYEMEPTEAIKLKSLKELAESLRLNGSFVAAYDSLQSYLKLQEKLQSSELKADLQEAETRYQSSQKEQEILNLKFQQAQQHARNQQILFIITLVLLSLCVLVIVLYLRARHRRKAHAQLAELDKLKSKLFANISHEFRTPLSLIRGPIDFILKKENVSTEVNAQLEIVQRNTGRLAHLIDSINDLAKLDAQKIKLAVKTGDLSAHLRIMAASFESLAESGQCVFETHLQNTSALVCYDPGVVETIIYNLLSNAFKYTPKGRVDLSYTQLDNQAMIMVEDNGIGLSKEDQAKVFERYFRADNTQVSVEGIGIGLALSAELAKLHHGKIDVQSSLGKGSRFTLSFPIRETAYAAGEKSPVEGPKKNFTAASYSLSSVTETLGQKVHEDESLILLVEDNPDMRNYLEQLFQGDYRILTAKNGKEGLKKAIEFIPDLIISDLMMPKMDGQEFLQQLRSDSKTSHIPFIMLTANHLEGEKLKSLQQGVDDFMTKPFSIDEILLKVQNLIQLRQQLQKKYSETSVIDPTKLAANDADARFWDEIKKVVNDNLANAEFDSSDFARAMHMSRMQLHRKLKALTGLSTAHFVRSQRLATAATLLEKNLGNVSEIAYDVGFTSPFYFSKCFKETYGVAPRDYAKVSS
jgi:signal transduction histidine kinase/DNA-binding response OmpR family regulator